MKTDTPCPVCNSCQSLTLATTPNMKGKYCVVCADCGYKLADVGKQTVQRIIADVIRQRSLAARLDAITH